MSKDDPALAVDFSALQRKRRLPPPPNDASDNLAAPEDAPAAQVEPVPPMTPSGNPDAPRRKVIRPYVPVQAAPEPVDGRSRLRTGRVEPFSTRVRADFRARLIALADHYGVTMGEALELAVAALEREAGPRG